jgi:hypothetical protein
MAELGTSKKLVRLQLLRGSKREQAAGGGDKISKMLLESIKRTVGLFWIIIRNFTTSEF